MKTSKKYFKVSILLTVLILSLFFSLIVFAQNADTALGAETASGDFVSASAVRAVEPWDATKVYNGGDQCSHNGIIWQAKYWTQGNEPGTHEVWQQISVSSPTPTVPPPTPGSGSVAIEFRDMPSQVAPGAKIEITADFKNTSQYEIADANATLTFPSSASLDTYDWNLATQPVNGVGALLSNKQLPPVPPQLFAYGSDDFNNTIEDIQGHIGPLNDLGRKMSVNVLAGSLYYDAWGSDITSFYGTNLLEYMKSKGYEFSSHTFHHSHMGLDLHMNSMWIGESSRRYKRGSKWGIPNTDQEQAMEITLGKFWNEIYFDRRMEGFRSPFLEFNITAGAETKTKSPLRSSKWGVIGKAGLRYVCSVNEAPNPYNKADDAMSTITDLDPRCAIPSWPPLCDEVTASSSAEASYTNANHNVHNILVGTQRTNTGTKQEWGTIFDGSLMETFSYDVSMKFLKAYTDRHFSVTQTEVPQTYITGVQGARVKHANVPLSFGLHASYTNNKTEFWPGVKNNAWVSEIDTYIKTNYPNAKNVTHKDILDYYLGMGTVRWSITMPTTPGVYTFSIAASGGSTKDVTIEVKAPKTMYEEVPARVVKVKNASEVAGMKAAGYNAVLFVVKDATHDVDMAGLQQVINAATTEGVDVYCEVSVFKDITHTSQTLDYAGNVIPHIAEPTDNAYRESLKTLLGQLTDPKIKGIILDANLPTNHSDGPSYGYSDAMVSHFQKYFGTPPTGADPQDPTSESDPLHWSIYTAAATSDWRGADIDWLYYDIKELANTYYTTGNMANLGTDVGGVQVVDWLLCKAADGSDNTGVSSWDEWEAWAEFRRYMIADFVNEVATGSTKPVYALVKGEKNAGALQSNSIFGTNTDPIEFAAATRRPCMLTDKWNQSKTQNLSGIIYLVDGAEANYVAECVDTGRKVDYWVAKGGNGNRGMMPANEYRPANDTTVYGSYVLTELSGTGAAFDAIRYASATANGNAPAITIVSKHKDEPNPVLTNVAVGKAIFTSGNFGPDFPKENLVDGNPATIWGSKLVSQVQGNQWFFVDLGKQYAIEGLIINWFDKYYGTKYSIGVSNDAKTWTLTQNLTNAGPGADIIQEKQTCRYVGVLLTGANDIAYGISEFEVFSYQK